ncbi:uncharacterized protein A1O5_10627 [Cladophialophora psammophila CBS 110553]|uniref:Choline transporter n=1 Tax=Cladophialophora psammophila CBS 110553 TaxID=1182543 RepID=W9WN88_9EURO|nr:uncharacterized protein A1O5_10627 [Cladophialophora psammophila CBS 110553]EXJ66475.1 hypothetical protein A1O5_10627 [Cladophialophora psammophila CBS 110553]
MAHAGINMKLFAADESAPIKKSLSFFGILAAGYNVSNSWLVVAATMVVSLIYGPMNTIWGLCTTTLFYACIGLTLAELVSAYPTTGGQYHWTSILAPASISRPASYFTGFISWFSWLTLAASAQGALSYLVYALAFSNNPNFVPHPWMSFLLYEAMTCLSVLMNLFLHKLLPKYYMFGFILSLLSFVVITVTCFATAKDKSSSSFVWLTSISGYGWPKGVDFLIALASPVVAFCPLDGAVHLVEEVKQAPKVVPRTILAALSTSFLTSIVFTLSALYSISDFDSVLSTPSGFLLWEVWAQATGSTAATTVFTCLIIVLLPVGSIACTQVDSMMTWSLGCDKALAFSNKLGTINKRLQAPVWALLLNGFLMFLIGILYLFSTLAFNAIIGSAIILQQITFAVPAILLIYHRRSPEALPTHRAFRLPNWLGWFVNVSTVLCTICTTIFFLLPSTSYVDSETMNYACVVVTGVLLLALVNWIAFARKHYHGPRSITLHRD